MLFLLFCYSLLQNEALIALSFTCWRAAKLKYLTPDSTRTTFLVSQSMIPTHLLTVVNNFQGYLRMFVDSVDEAQHIKYCQTYAIHPCHKYILTNDKARIALKLGIISCCIKDDRHSKIKI